MKQTTIRVGRIVARQRGNDEVDYRVNGKDEKLAFGRIGDVARRHVRHTAERGTGPRIAGSNGTTRRIVDALRIGPAGRSVVPMKQTQESEQ